MDSAWKPQREILRLVPQVEKVRKTRKVEKNMRINPQLFYERYQRGHHLPRTLPHWRAVFIDRNQRGISPYLSVTNGVNFPVFYRTEPVGNFPRIYALDEL